MYSKFMCASPGRLALGVSVEGDRYVGFYLQSGHLVTDNQITTVRVTTWHVIFVIFAARLNWCKNNLVWGLGPILSQGHFKRWYLLLFSLVQNIHRYTSQIACFAAWTHADVDCLFCATVHPAPRFEYTHIHQMSH